MKAVSADVPDFKDQVASVPDRRASRRADPEGVRVATDPVVQPDARPDDSNGDRIQIPPFSARTLAGGAAAAATQYRYSSSTTTATHIPIAFTVVGLDDNDPSNINKVAATRTPSQIPFAMVGLETEEPSINIINELSLATTTNQENNISNNSHEGAAPTQTNRDKEKKPFSWKAAIAWGS